MGVEPGGVVDGDDGAADLELAIALVAVLAAAGATVYVLAPGGWPVSV